MLSTILREHSRTFHGHATHHHNHLFSLLWARPMGGGPRTFPGGLNKWQWKRLHEKKAREKEKRLLDQEKHLYQARLRSHIRASNSGQSDPGSGPEHGPMSPRDHIRALADRFVRPGAEDLWNDDDEGPPRKPGAESGVDLGRLFEANKDVGSGLFSGVSFGNVQQKRGFRIVPGGGDHGSLSNFRFGGGFGRMRGFRVSGGTIGGDGDHGNLSNFGFWGGFRQMRGFRVRSGMNESGELSNSMGCYGDLPRSECRGVYDNVQQVRAYRVSGSFGGSLQQTRGYSVKMKGGFKRRFRGRKDDSSSSDEGDYGIVRGNTRWPRFSLEGEGTGKGSDEEEEGEREGGRGLRGFMGNAALGKYDVKKTKRRIMRELERYADQEEEEEEGNLAGRIEEIRKEVNERKLVQLEKPEEKSDQEEEDFVGTKKRFEDCGVSPLTVKALTSAGYVLMTRVQEATLPVCLEGMDALVKARAGTGKTAAFLLPAIETVLKAMSSNKVQRVPPICVLILCPTRELASQIAAETRVMLKYHNGIGVQTLTGGTRFKDDLKRLESDPCQILVATPGRLLDHIETRSSLSVRLMGLKMLVLDEADNLLDLGFRKDMEKIVDCLPRQRQSLLFSATIPKEVRRISQLVLKREHALVNADAGCPETSSKVKQSYIVAPHDVHFQVVYQLLKEHISNIPDYKVIVFCTTGMVASLMYLLLREMRLNVREMHTRKPQLYRSRVTDEFKQSKRLILISSDVSARGMSYPDVTLVIQVGVPSDREQYIHRIGRTGRQGKDGEGIMLLAPWEEHFLDDLKDLPVERSSAPHVNPDAKVKMEDSMAKIDTSVKEAAYHAWLGYYNSMREIGRDKTSLVKWANQFCESIGLQKPPALFRKTVIKMGLKDIPGIRVRK